MDDLYERLFVALKKYMEESCTFKVYIYKKPSTDNFPKVIFQEILNLPADKMHSRMETVSNIGYEINIFTKDQEIDGVICDSSVVAKYISGIIREYFDYKTFLNLVINKKTPNIDETIYRITMQYTGQSSDYRGHLY